MTNASRFIVIALFAGAPAMAAAQDALGPVRELYASAEYEEALTALGRLKTDAALTGGVEIDRYRVLCLIALGRSAEADKTIEAIVTDDPLYQPAPGDAAPRVRTAFSDVRRRLLPGIVRTLYADAKAAYDRKEYKDSAQKLEKTVRVMDDPDMGGHPELSDLRMLAAGFLDLSRAAAGPSRMDGPVATSGTTGPAPGVVAPKVPLLTDPVALRQDMPRWSLTSAGALRGEFRGAVEVDIDEAGTVVSAIITQPIHPMYDALLLRVAKDWRYEPARRNGQAIKSRKRVEVVLRDK